MAYVDFGIVHKVRRLLTDFAAYREELRTERHLNSLPEHVLKDIGWPDAYAERLARRGSMKMNGAGTEDASTDHAPWQVEWPKPRQARKTGISGSFRVQY